MAYTKGESGNISGRKPGSKNLKVKEWEILRDSIIGPHTQRFNEILEKADDDKFCELFLIELEGEMGLRRGVSLVNC